jgi:hypothetical protein
MARRRRKTRYDLDGAIQAMFSDLELRMKMLYGELMKGQSPSQHRAIRASGAHLGLWTAHRLYRLLRKKARAFNHPLGRISVRVKIETRTEHDIRKAQTPGDLVRRQRSE